MMTFVNMDADGLVILPTHRVVHSLGDFDEAAFLKGKDLFEVDVLPGCENASEFLNRLKAETGVAFVSVTRNASFLMRAKPEAAAALAALPEHEQKLDLSYLHGVIFEKLLGLDAEKLREGANIRYLRDASEAVDLVRRGQADIAFLTSPVTLEQLREVAFGGSVMPQKSTDFFPKLLSGLAIYALD